MRGVTELTRLLAFAAGGTFGGFFVLLFLYVANPADGFDLSAGLSGSVIRFPASLLVGAGIGAIAWLGFALGRAHWMYLAARPGHSLYRMPVVIALAGVYLLLGIASSMIGAFFPTDPGPPWWLAAAIAFLPLPVGIPLGAGYVSGFGEREHAGAAALGGLVFGPIIAFWFALCSGVTSLVIPPASPTSPLHYSLPPLFVAILVLLSGLPLTVLGLALGFVTGCADGFGLVFQPVENR